MTEQEREAEAERMRSKAAHDEAQAIRNAALKERKKWESVIEEKDALIAELRARLGEDNP